MYSAAVWPLWPRSLERISATLGRSHAPASAPVAMAASSNSARAGSTDVAIESDEADERAHRAGAGGADQDDLAAVAGAGQRRLPRAGDAAEGGGDEDDQEPGADLRHLGLDGVEHPDETAQQDEQREQRGRDAGGGRPRDRAHSCCSQDVHIAEASQRCGARREAQDPTWSWAVLGSVRRRIACLPSRAVGGRRSLTIAVLCAAIAGCGGGAPAARSPAKAPAAEASATRARSAGVRHAPLRSPCSVLPMYSCSAVYGAMKPLGYVRQEYYDHSLTPAEFKRKTDTRDPERAGPCATTTAATRADTSVRVTVEQYRSDKAARSEWASIAYLGTGKESRKLAKRDFSGPVLGLQLDREARAGERARHGRQAGEGHRRRAVRPGPRGLRRLPAQRARPASRTCRSSFVTPVFSAGQYRKQAARPSGRSASSTSSWTAPTWPSTPARAGRSTASARSTACPTWTRAAC